MIRPLLTFVLLAGIAGNAMAATQPEQLDLRSKAQPLALLLESIADQCDAGLVVHQSVQARLAHAVTLTARKATWAEASRWLADEHRMTMRLVGNRLEIGDADREFRARLVSATYDLRILTLKMGSFTGIDLDIPEPGGVGSRLLPPIEPGTVPSVNDVVTLLQRHIAPDTWEIEGVGIREMNNDLVVVQVPEIQERIATFIADLERTAARQVVVRCHRLPAGAPLPTILDRTAWSTLAKNLTAPDGMVVLFDEQRSHHFSGTQRAVILDADVNQEAFDPLFSTISDGLALDVETYVTNAGVITTTRLSTTSKQVLTPAPLISAQGKVLSPIDLPASDLDRTRDTRVIPDGGAAVYQFGGQAYALSVEVLDFTRKP